MEKLVEEGLVKTIGISNFSVKKIEDLLQYAKITPAVNQVELHPYFRNEKLHKYCDSKVIARPHWLDVRRCQAPTYLLLDTQTAKQQLSFLALEACHLCMFAVIRAWLQCAH